MIRRSIAAVAIAFAGTVATLLAFPGAAYATTYTFYAEVAWDRSPSLDSTCASVLGGAGVACFQPYGDKFWIRDNQGDGMHVEMRGWVSDDKFICWTDRGATYPWQVCEGFSHLISEGQRIKFNAQLWDGGKQMYVSDYKYATT